MAKRDADKLFDAAKEIGLRRPGACTLLIYRELRERRLRSFADGRPSITSKAEKRVTARFEDAAVKKEFSDHVRDIGLGSDEAAYLLFQAELAEGWLRATLAQYANHA